jgi:hypothetical protein
MAAHFRILAISVLASATLLTACEKAAPPPPPAPVAPPAPQVNAEIKRLASEVFVFAYPLVLMDVTKDAMTATTPVNHFAHERSLPEPGAKQAGDPNGDVLFSRAWIDVSKEPVVITVPDFRDRYYLIALIDAWTNVFASLGTRTIGPGKQAYAIVGPNWKGKVPEETPAIKAPTGMVWAVGRIAVAGASDQAAVRKLQDQIELEPLSEWKKKKPARRGKAKAAEPEPERPVQAAASPVDQVAAMDAATYFTRFASLLPANPPTKDDAPMVEKIKSFGIVGGQPYSTAQLDPPSVRGVDAGMKTVYATMVSAAGGSLGELRNGWTIQAATGRYGTDYGTRAVMALVGLGANAPEDAVFAATRLDGTGKPLHGDARYVLHFPKGAAPPTEAFWSLSMYDEAHRLVANPLERYRIGDRDKLKSNADGSLDIWIGSANPGEGKESNWLPAPKGEFNLMLRIYWPKPDVVERRWAPPGIQPVS